MKLPTLPFCAVLLSGAAMSCSRAPEQLAYTLIATLPHDPACYTQGLEFSGGRLYESAGMYGESNVREVDPANGSVLRKRPIPATIFAEGITILNGELWNLTWKAGKVTVIDAASFKFLRTLSYHGEGWGLANDGKQLIMSNGSSTLYFRDPLDFSVKRSITVKDGDKEVDQLNELEYDDGAIYANIYQKDRVARIDPASGRVTGWLDLSGLRQQLPDDSKLPPRRRAEALNGIALTPDRKHFLVTGKYWPKMFRIEIQE